MEFLTRFKNALFLIAVLLAQAIALAVQVRTPADAAQPDGQDVRLIRRWTQAGVTPFERIANGAGSLARRAWLNYADLRRVRRQNDELKTELIRVRLAQAAIAEDAMEGRRLQALLGFKERYVGATVAAQVIGASGSDQSHVLTIDKGYRDGLRPDMAVITQDGVVGKLRDVFPDSAQVLEINDQTSGAGVILASTRIRAILRGSLSGQTQITNLTADSRIKPGEHVLTSGGDQVYPRGLPVGTVQSMRPDPDHQPYMAIAVRPAVDLGQVSEVLVITGTQAELPALAQQDLAAAEAQHAADISAEKLPSLHDGEETPAAGQPGAATPPSADSPVIVTIPKPLPTMHPDRYSSGSSPPAADLTPGATVTSPAAAPAIPERHPSPDDRTSGAPPQIP